MKAKSGYLYNKKLSFSQLNTWINSKNDYINYYINGEKFITNKYIEWGNAIHKKIEKGEIDIFSLQEKEKYLEREVYILGEKVILNGYIDSYEPGKLIDYKTSQKEWTQKKVDSHLQLDFYKKLLNEDLQMAIINIVLDQDKPKYIKNFVKTTDNSELLEKKLEEFISWAINFNHESGNNQLS